MDSDILTVDELAEYLKVDPQTVYRRFRRGEIPGVRIGKAIRFKREVIDNWLRLMSYRWNAQQRAELRRWAEEFARERGTSEPDVLAAIGRRRYGRR